MLLKPQDLFVSTFNFMLTFFVDDVYIAAQMLMQPCKLQQVVCY